MARILTLDRTMNRTTPRTVMRTFTLRSNPRSGKVRVTLPNHTEPISNLSRYVSEPETNLPQVRYGSLTFSQVRACKPIGPVRVYAPHTLRGKPLRFGFPEPSGTVFDGPADSFTLDKKKKIMSERKSLMNKIAYAEKQKADHVARLDARIKALRVKLAALDAE